MESKEEDFLEEGLKLGILSEPIAEDNIINHPNHYTAGGIESLDIIKAKSLNKDWYLGGLFFNILKYVQRAPHKGKMIRDFKKARFYINKIIEELEDKKVNNV